MTMSAAASATQSATVSPKDQSATTQAPSLKVAAPLAAVQASAVPIGDSKSAKATATVTSKKVGQGATAKEAAVSVVSAARSGQPKKRRNASSSSSASTASAAPKKRKRSAEEAKIRHRAVERRRMLKINTLINEIKTELVTMGHVVRKDKASILQAVLRVLRKNGGNNSSASGNAVNGNPAMPLNQAYGPGVPQQPFATQVSVMQYPHHPNSSQMMGTMRAHGQNAQTPAAVNAPGVANLASLSQRGSVQVSHDSTAAMGRQ